MIQEHYVIHRPRNILSCKYHYYGQRNILLVGHNACMAPISGNNTHIARERYSEAMV